MFLSVSWKNRIILLFLLLFPTVVLWSACNPLGILLSFYVAVKLNIVKHKVLCDKQLCCSDRGCVLLSPAVSLMWCYQAKYSITRTVWAWHCGFRLLEQHDFGLEDFVSSSPKIPTTSYLLILTDEAFVRQVLCFYKSSYRPATSERSSTCKHCHAQRMPTSMRPSFSGGIWTHETDVGFQISYRLSKDTEKVVKHSKALPVGAAHISGA